MKYKRFIAYFIDFVLLSIFIGIVSMVFQTDNMNSLQMEMSTLNEQFLTKKVDFVTYLNYYSIILHDMDMQNLLIHIIGVLYIGLYYILLPYKNNGKTFGKSLMHIEVFEDGDRKLKTYIGRCMLINGLGYLLLSILFVLLLPSFLYFFLLSILGILQIVLVLGSAFMILYREDGRGVHDIWTKSYVRECEEVKK